MMLGKKGKTPLPRPFFRPSHGEGCMVKNREKNKWGQPPFCKKEDILIKKMGPGPICSLGQKQRILEPYSLSLSSMVAATISQNLCPQYSSQLSRNRKCLIQACKT
jgi:hypothetical protein